MSLELIIIADRSGSMQSIASDSIGGFNKLLEDQKAVKTGIAKLSLVMFNTDYDTPFYRRNVEEIPELTNKTFVPSGGTSLLDAIGNTLPQFANAFKNDNTVEGVLVCIITDGEENSSTKFTKAQIKEMITEYEKMGWNFIYLGANQDAFHEGAKYGMSNLNSRNYVADAKGIRHAYNTVSMSASNYRSAISSKSEFDLADSLNQADAKLNQENTQSGDLH